jgi:hypothetical protein
MEKTKSPLIWLSDEPTGHCTLDSTWIPNTTELERGISVAANFPKDIVYQMSKRFPKDFILSDNFNVAGQIIVSKPLKEHLMKLLTKHKIEWLPVSIANHKNKVVSNDYFILHSLNVVDCIDIDKSIVEWNPLDKTILMGCEGLVIDEFKISDEFMIFRPLHWGSKTMVLPELANELEAAGFTGFRFVEATGYIGIG